MNSKGLLHLFTAAIISVIVSFIAGGCAQVGVPSGGPKDSIPPKLVTAVPDLFKTNFTGNKIVFTFDEYIVVEDAQKNVLVSPFPKTAPQIDFKLKTVTVKLKDTLLENTTYAINFGNAIKDNNELNPFRNFTYVFSTGNTIDSLTLSGQVILAETGKKDSTIIAMLYRNADDTTVQHRRPDYIARLNSEGKFTFTNLSKDSYKLYALKDNDGRKTYNDKAEMFAFNDSNIVLRDSVSPVTIYAYVEEKDIKKNAVPPKAQAEKKLRYSTPVSNGAQSLLSGLDITFNRSLKSFDADKIILTDSLYKKIDGASLTLDSTKKILTLQNKWAEGYDYRLIIDSAAVTDTLNSLLSKTDTVKFKSKGPEDYGNLVLRFTNLDTAKHPVLQFIKGEEIFRSVPVTTSRWSDRLFEPGDYELRVLYDNNGNGKWDPGNYEKKLQPEKAITLDKRLTIRAKWDNEREIQL